jgi:hypothetical protein
VEWRVPGHPGTYGNVGGVANTPSAVGSATPTLAKRLLRLVGYVRLPYRMTLALSS